MGAYRANVFGNSNRTKQILRQLELAERGDVLEAAPPSVGRSVRLAVARWCYMTAGDGGSGRVINRTLSWCTPPEHTPADFTFRLLPQSEPLPRGLGRLVLSCCQWFVPDMSICAAVWTHLIACLSVCLLSFLISPSHIRRKRCSGVP